MRHTSKIFLGQNLVHLTCQGQYKKVQECILNAPILTEEFLRTENDYQRSPIFVAAHRHYQKCLISLIETGKGDVSLTTENGITPLHLAAKSDSDDNNEVSEADLYEGPSLKTVEYLISVGADLFAKDLEGCIPLHYACKYGAAKVVGMLLQRDEIYQIEAEDHEGLTPIMHAIRNGREEVVRYLLGRGANIEKVTYHQCNVFHYVFQSGNIRVLNLIENHFNFRLVKVASWIKSCNFDGETPLHWASVTGDLTMVKQCLRLADYDINFRTPKGETQLHIVAQCHNFVGIDRSFVAVLANVPDNYEQTPLFNAIENSDIESVQYLLSCGARTNLVDIYHMSPLLRAATIGRADICKLLLTREKDLILETDNRGRNALMLAAKWKHPDVIETILDDDSGVKLIDREDNEGSTALHLAVRSGNFKIVKTLLQHKADVRIQNAREYTALHIAAIFGRTDISAVLCTEFDKLTSETDENGNYAIHLAAEYGHVQILKRFSHDPALKNAENIQGRTPLAVAAEHNRADCVQLLLKENANVDAGDRGKITPLMLACKMGNSQIVSMLIEEHADPAKCAAAIHPQYPGWNSLDFAVDAGSLPCVKLILDTNKWRNVLRNVTLGSKQKVVTPFRRMVRHLPSAAKLVLDRCVSDTRIGDQLETTFNYEFIEELCLHFPKDSHYQWESDSTQTFRLFAKKSKPKQYGVDNPNSLESQVHASPGTKKISKNNLKSFGKFGKRLRTARKIISGICSCCTKRKHRSDNAVLGLDVGNEDAIFEVEEDDVIVIPRPTHIMNYMIKHDREDLLNHKLTCSLLTYKWVRTAILFYINLVIYMVFLSLFTAFMLVNRPPFEVFGGNISQVNTFCQNLKNSGMVANRRHISTPKYGVLVLASVRLAMELGELVVRRLDYFEFVNMLEVSMYALALLTVIDTNPCMSITQLRSNWQWNTGAVGILLAWFDFLLFIRKGPYFGIYVIMFAAVLRTFVKVFTVFSPFILGFVFAFHDLMFNKMGFKSVKNSLIKTLGMTAGELDASSILFAGDISTEYADLVFYKDITFTVFTLSIALVTIAMMNLLIGLAVDDIKEVQRRATLESLRMKIQMVFDTEGNTKRCCSFLEVPKYYTYRPSRPGSFFDRFFKYQFEDSQKAIRNVVAEEAEELDTVMDTRAYVQDKVNRLQVQTKQIARVLDKLASRYAPGSADNWPIYPSQTEESYVPTDQTQTFLL